MKRDADAAAAAAREHCTLQASGGSLFQFGVFDAVYHRYYKLAASAAEVEKGRAT